MATTSANYVFLPWMREGTASRIQTPDSLGAAQAGVVSLPITLRMASGDSISQTMRVLGPGDVTGVDPQQIVRREPRDRATNFEPNYFPAIEFDRPDFPWLFTPAKALADGKLRPWLCLVVVRQRDGVVLRSGTPLAILEVADPDSELPNLDESWAWVHTQVSGAARTAPGITQALAGDPALTISRLVCPRRLDPLTSYIACLVPAFALGCKAGLGDPITTVDESTLDPAWKPGDGRAVLPVYDHWTFRTGEGGDFEALVRLLQPRKIDPSIGQLLVDLSESGLNLGATAPLEMQAALCVSRLPNNAQPAFAAAIQPILNTPANAITVGTTDPLLAPPLYGSWQAARHTVNLSSQTWLDDLNLDPRHRAAAALGTQVVQAQQELLMAAAWEQLGDIKRVNQLRRQAQLGREINTIYHTKHFSNFEESTLLQIAAPSQNRLVLQTTAPDHTTIRTLLAYRVAKSALPATAISAPMRRITSARSPVIARFPKQSPLRSGGIARVVSSSLSSRVLSRLATAPTLVETADPAATNPVTMDEVSDRGPVPLKPAVRSEALLTTLTNGQGLGHFVIAPEDSTTVLTPVLPGTPIGSPIRLPDNADAQAFRAAAKAHAQYAAGLTPPIAAPPPTLDLTATRVAVLLSLSPSVTIAARVDASLVVAGTAPQASDALAPILDTPTFTRPMYEGLRDLSQDFLFPGLADIPAETVTVLETNPAFVEAFLVGLNSEMNRELLWRGYPTDQRGTYFQQFWESVSATQSDIDVISKWDANRLGSNMRVGDELVLLVRGELLRRYPSAVIYAVPATPQLELSTDVTLERHPLFRGTLDPDITFLGFALKKEEALGNPGWFFVIQEQPTEPRFGLDVANYTKPAPALTTWNDLSWQHFADTADKLTGLTHAPARFTLPTIANVTWGRNGGHQAVASLQRPVRIAIRAKDMIAS